MKELTDSQENTNNFESIIESFLEEVGGEDKSEDIETLCMSGFKQLKLASAFTKIDEKILDLSIKNDKQDSSFFTDLLYLEAKRLRFKEEVTKCSETQDLKRVKI